MDGGEELRIVLLGKTGVGKSSVGNTFLEENVFEAKCSLNSVTQNCERAEKDFNGRKIAVIDTPGIFDTNRSEEEIKKEIISSLEKCAPGPHVFILVLKVDRYTLEMQQTVEKLLKYFNDDVLNHMVLLFTHGDDLKQNMTIQDFINHSEKKGNNSGKQFLEDLAERCGNRVHVIDNKHWNGNEDSRDLAVLATLQSLNLPEQDIKKITEQMQSWREYRTNQFQITQLMKSIQTILKDNNGQHYRNKTLMEKLFNRDVKRSTIQRVNMVETRRSVERAEDFVEIHNSLSHFIEIPELDEKEELRIVLLGKTAAGRSSVGNTILGEKVFNTGCSVNSVTQNCERAEKVINGRRIVVIDTPGMFDPDRSEEEIKDEIISSLIECTPGPHVFILVLKVERHTQENQKALQQLLKYFTDSIFPHMILLFTHGEELKENMTIIDFINQSDDKKKNSGKYTLKDLAERCGNRVHVIDNKHWNENSSYLDILARLKQLNLPEQTIRDIAEKMESTPADKTPWFNIQPEQCNTAESENKDENDERYKNEYRSNRFQLTQLMKNAQTILSKNKGQYYSNETLMVVGKVINEEVENILKEMCVERETADMVEIKRRARERVKNKVQRQLSSIAVGTLLGALLGVGVGVAAPVVMTAGLIRKTWSMATYQLPQDRGLPKPADRGAGLLAGAAAVAGSIAEVEALAAGAATGIGAAVGAGGIFLYGAGKGYEVAKTADNPKQAADKAAKAVTQKAEDVLKACWNLD